MDTKDIILRDSINEGLYLLDKGEYDKAMDIFMKTRRIYPKAHEVWWIIGCCHYTEKKIQKTLKKL